jgi:hypothetical protein
MVANKAVDIGVERLAMPPGANYCDVILMSHDNTPKFEAKLDYEYYRDGTRQNLMSGNVKIKWCPQEQVYLGIRNPDSTDAINVSIEVIAVTVKEEYVMAGN